MVTAKEKNGTLGVLFTQEIGMFCSVVANQRQSLYAYINVFQRRCQPRPTIYMYILTSSDWGG